MADLTDLHPVSKSEFAAELTPCLVLTAPAGMTEDAKRAWFAAAYKALDGIPIALLKRGAEAAMLTADHPSKIVPAIRKAVSEDWEWRRRYRANPRPQPHALLPRVPESERREVAVEIGQLAARLKEQAEKAA